MASFSIGNLGRESVESMSNMKFLATKNIIKDLKNTQNPYNIPKPILKYS